MEMSPLQIASEYRTGKNKTKTIKVLAELNAVTQRQIAQLLADQGEELPGHWKAKLEAGLKTKPVSDRYLKEALVEAVTPETGDPSTPLRSAQDDSVKKERIATAACALPRNDSAALSLDEIRQAAACALPRNDSAALSQDSDPASRAGALSWAQFSRMMTLLGRIEGASMVLEGRPAAYLLEIVDNLRVLADELRPEV